MRNHRDERAARTSLLKPSMIPIRVLSVLVLVLLTLGREREARAAPRDAAAEDRQGDGDLDADDLVGHATLSRSTVRRALGGDAWISLGGFARRTVQGEREVGGLVVVGLPLDRIARGERTASQLGPAALGPPSVTKIAVSSAEAEPVVARRRGGGVALGFPRS
jgi:hypothetical protein